MLSSVLNSERAIQVNIEIMRSFVRLNLRRVAQVLNARVRVVFEPEETNSGRDTVRAAVSRRAVRRKQKRGQVS